MNVLITDGNNRSSLAVTRSLGKKGIRVFVAEQFSNNLSSWSRYCHKSFTYPPPSTHWSEFLSTIHSIVSQESIDLIVPMTDLTMTIILSASDEFNQAHLRALPTRDAYMAVTDKINLLKLARQLGVPAPRSHIVETPDDLDRALRSISFPVVLKPARSRLLDGKQFVATSVKYAQTSEQLLSLYHGSSVFKRPFIIQDVVHGFGAGIFVLFHQGKPITYFCHRRLREKPPSGGVSVLCESTPVDPNLEKFAEILLRTVGWNGVAMAEFKVEVDSGIPYLMEVNGRFWGSLQLAIDSGVDFPAYLCNIASGGPSVNIVPYKVGRKSRWFLGDLDHLYIRLFKNEGNNALSNQMASRARAVLEFLKYNGKHCKLDVFQRSDIKPFLLELKQYLFLQT